MKKKTGKTPIDDGSAVSTFTVNDRLLSRYFRTANLLASRTSRWLIDQNITSQQWSVLGSLSLPRLDDGMTVNQLSEYLMVTRQNLTVVLDRLDLRGLTVRAPDITCGRTKRVRLTPNGRKLVSSISPRLADFYEATLKGFSEDEKQMFMNFVDRMKLNIANS